VNENISYYKLHDKEVVRCTFEEYAQQNKHQKIVKQEEISDLFLSTVFFGTSFSDGCFFESILFDENFNNKEISKALLCVRYSTYKEAEEGHKAIVKKIKGWIDENGLLAVKDFLRDKFLHGEK